MLGVCLSQVAFEARDHANQNVPEGCLLRFAKSAELEKSYASADGYAAHLERRYRQI